MSTLTAPSPSPLAAQRTEAARRELADSLEAEARSILTPTLGAGTVARAEFDKNEGTVRVTVDPGLGITPRLSIWAAEKVLAELHTIAPRRFPDGALALQL